MVDWKGMVGHIMGWVANGGICWNVKWKGSIIDWLPRLIIHTPKSAGGTDCDRDPAPPVNHTLAIINITRVFWPVYWTRLSILNPSFWTLHFDNKGETATAMAIQSLFLAYSSQFQPFGAIWSYLSYLELFRAIWTYLAWSHFVPNGVILKYLKPFHAITS